MQEGCTAALERLERDGFLIRGVILPTPKEDTDPCEGSGAHGRLVCLPFVALLLIRDLGPEGMPDGCRRPCHARVAQARRTLEAPVPPGLFATACRDRCHARVCLEFCGGGEAFALCAAGDEEAGRTHGSGPWQGVKQGEVGMRLGTWRHGGVAVGHGRQRDAEWGHEGVYQEHLGGDDAVIGGQRPGAFDGLEAGGEDVGRAHVVGSEEPFQGGAAGMLCGCEGRPVAQDVAKNRRIFFGKPWHDLWKGVFEGTGQAVRTPDCVTDQATAMFDEWGEGTHGGALGLQGLARVTVCQQKCDLEFRIGGVVCGTAGGAGFPVPGHGERIDGKEHEELIVAEGRHHGPLMKFQAYRARASAEARAQGLAPGVNGFRAVCEAQALPPRSARDVEAAIVLSLCPIEADKGGECCVYHTCHV
jgi:hypothetical protein